MSRHNSGTVLHVSAHLSLTCFLLSQWQGAFSDTQMVVDSTFYFVFSRAGSLPEWGVTVLQADEEMDAGDVWTSSNFSVPHSSTLTKSAFYNKASHIYVIKYNL